MGLDWKDYRSGTRVSGIILRIVLGFSIVLTIAVCLAFLGLCFYLIGLDNIMVIVLLLVMLGLCWMVGEEYLYFKLKGKK
jgi:hypothetical protein